MVIVHKSPTEFRSVRNILSIHAVHLLEGEPAPYVSISSFDSTPIDSQYQNSLTLSNPASRLISSFVNLTRLASSIPRIGTIFFLVRGASVMPPQ